MNHHIQIQDRKDLPPKKTQGRGKWQKMLADLETGTIFTVGNDLDQSAISKYRSIRTAAKTIGCNTTMRQLDDGKIMIKISSEQE